LLKIRLKQSVIERKARTGPLAQRRQERLLLAHQRRLQKQVALAQVTSMCLMISNFYSPKMLVLLINKEDDSQTVQIFPVFQSNPFAFWDLEDLVHFDILLILNNPCLSNSKTLIELSFAIHFY
jgi:hypothetical protein